MKLGTQCGRREKTFPFYFHSFPSFAIGKKVEQLKDKQTAIEAGKEEELVDGIH